VNDGIRDPEEEIVLFNNCRFSIGNKRKL
jgi:hypothetical protein